MEGLLFPQLLWCIIKWNLIEPKYWTQWILVNHNYWKWAVDQQIAYNE